MKKAAPVLMEPIMKIAVTVPDEYIGDVIGDINAAVVKCVKWRQESVLHR